LVSFFGEISAVGKKCWAYISEGRGRKERASVFVFVFIFRNFCFATKVANLIIGRKMAKKWPSEDLAKNMTINQI